MGANMEEPPFLVLPKPHVCVLCVCVRVCVHACVRAYVRACVCSIWTFLINLCVDLWMPWHRMSPHIHLKRSHGHSLDWRLDKILLKKAVSPPWTVFFITGSIRTDTPSH